MIALYDLWGYITHFMKSLCLHNVKIHKKYHSKDFYFYFTSNNTLKLFFFKCLIYVIFRAFFVFANNFSFRGLHIVTNELSKSFSILFIYPKIWLKFFRKLWGKVIVKDLYLYILASVFFFSKKTINMYLMLEIPVACKEF